jgi:excisionase family DNA binding protein
MSPTKCSPESPYEELPGLRFPIGEAARILRMSRAQLYNRISEGSIRHQKDGARSYITRAELERYVLACDMVVPRMHTAAGVGLTKGSAPAAGSTQALLSTASR